MTEHLKERELAKRWRMNRGTLANWRHRDQGPTYLKIGGRILYPMKAVEAWERAKTKRGSVHE